MSVELRMEIEIGMAFRLLWLRMTDFTEHDRRDSRSEILISDSEVEDLSRIPPGLTDHDFNRIELSWMIGSTGSWSIDSERYSWLGDV